MKNNRFLKTMSLWLQALAYMGAGVNHFINAASYITMIPPYFPFKPELNILVGVIEILLGGLLLIWKKQRKLVAGAIILFLIAVIPTHIYHIQMNGNIPGSSFVMPLWGAWLRMAIQFLLMGWAWSVRKY